MACKVFYFLNQSKSIENYNNKFQVQLKQMQSFYTPEQISDNITFVSETSAGLPLTHNYYLDYPQIINQLTLTNYSLNLEVQTLKKALQSATNELEITRKRSLQAVKMRERVAECERVKIRKIFKKDKYCPIQGCKNRYSSRIAVNAHIRKHHLRLPPVPRKKD